MSTLSNARLLELMQRGPESADVTLRLRFIAAKGYISCRSAHSGTVFAPAIHHRGEATKLLCDRESSPVIQVDTAFRFVKRSLVHTAICVSSAPAEDALYEC